MASQQQLRQSITEQIVAALESGGVPPWRRPWKVGPNAGSPANVVSRKAYRGINPILLDMAAARHGLTSKWWGTFNQWKQLGGTVMPRPSHVPSGRWGTTIVFWSPIKKAETNDRGEDEEDRFFVMRSYTVFNIDQVEGDRLDHLRAGREEDGTILDEIAHRRFDTPSKVALHISTTIKDNALAAITAVERIGVQVGRILGKELAALAHQAERVRAGVTSLIDQAGEPSHLLSTRYK